MRITDYPDLDKEQQALAEAYYKSDSEIGLFEYSYEHGSEELRRFYDQKLKQDEEDLKNAIRSKLPERFHELNFTALSYVKNHMN